MPLWPSAYIMEGEAGRLSLPAGLARLRDVALRWDRPRHPADSPMRSRLLHLRTALRDWLGPIAEPALGDAGHEGEIVIARGRIALSLLLLAGPTATLVRHPDELPARVAFLFAAGYIALGVWTIRTATRNPPPRWLGLLTTVADVSLVTAFHAMTFVTGFPLLALRSRAIFALYVFVIVATGLRYDNRLCLVAGLLAGTQWLALVWWVTVTGYADAALLDGRFYGDVTPAGQIEELVILAVATVLALVIVDRARVLRLSSVRDGLTGLLNQTYFEERLGIELERAARHRRPLVLILLDLDRFKSVNDTRGHPAGDTVLRAAAAQLRRLIRRTDLAARVGGDEFAIVLPESSLRDGINKAEEIRRAVEEAAIDAAGGQIAVTCSAGVALAGEDGTTAQALIDVADGRLFAAKRQGRNRVIGTGEPGQAGTPPAPPAPDSRRLG
ncbi:MAG: GGDEF domain-containing protein [Acidimicrobiia bacterium]|nr:GGDEF domain-containing protein [Acidimicrobiia bacterium]